MTDELIPIVKEGRRKTDIKYVLTHAPVTVVFWLVGPLLEPQPPHKPSMLRIGLANNLVLGWLMFWHEIYRQAGEPSIQPTVWTTWEYVTIALVMAVFFPKMFAQFAQSTIGGALVSTATATRDKLVERRRAKAAKITEPGMPLTEYNGEEPE